MENWIKNIKREGAGRPVMKSIKEVYPEATVSQERIRDGLKVRVKIS